MSFGAPLGLLALLASLPIVAAYFLRRRQPPRTVSALFLWRTPQHRAEAGAKLERFSRETSLLLELLAVAALALYLADPHVGAAKQARHEVVVLDGSLSMRAWVAGSTAAQRAKKALLELSGPDGLFTVVESGPKPALLVGPRANRQQLAAVLEQWQPSQPAHDVSLAFARATELAGDARHLIYFISDGPLTDQTSVPATVTQINVGRPADNLAFTSVQRRDEGPHATLTLRVTNFSQSHREVPVEVVLPDGGTVVSRVSLSAGATGMIGATLPVGVEVQARLPPDALPDDSQVTILPNPEPTVRVGFLTGVDDFSQQAILKLMRIAPGVEVTEPATLRFGPPASNAEVTLGVSGTTTSFVGPFFIAKSHPLLDDVQLGGVVWTAGPNPPGRPLVSAGAVALMTESDDGHWHLNLDLARSNVQRTAAWPILLMNMVREARRAQPGLPKRQLHLGEEVSVVVPPHTTWKLVGPGGVERPLLGSGVLTLAPLHPGRWRLVSSEGDVSSAEVMALDVAESDLRARGSGENTATDTQRSSAAAPRPRAWWPVALALALLLVDFWLTARTRRPGAAVA